MSSAVSWPSADYVCRPASEAYLARAPLAAEPGDFPLADAPAVAQPEERSAAAEQVRSWAAGRAHYVAEDDSSPDATDLAPVDSCPAGYRLAADDLVPSYSVAPTAGSHCVQAARTVDCSAWIRSAENDSPDLADSAQADSVAAG